jgi:hypothetical protein
MTTRTTHWPIGAVAPIALLTLAIAFLATVQ